LLGTVRLAALKNFGALRNAGTTLSDLDPLTTIARDSVTAHRTSGRRSDAIQCITDAHEHFNKITQQFMAATETATGLTYRVERSRYYVEQFNSNVRALRLGRLEGCQPYDEFVERRLGATFDFIHRLGLRYERAVNSLSMLDQNYLAIRANKTESDVREIQRYADFALIGFLLPYYLIGLISHILPVTHQSEFMIYLTILLSSALFAFGLYRFVESETFQPQKKLLSALVAFVAAALLASMALPLLQQYFDSAVSAQHDEKADIHEHSPH
jgi:hypothetical protein